VSGSTADQQLAAGAQRRCIGVFAMALTVRLFLWAVVQWVGGPRFGMPGQDGYCYMTIAKNIVAGRGFQYYSPRVRLDEPPLDVYLRSGARPDGAIVTLKRLHRRFDLTHLELVVCHGSGVGKPAATAPPVLTAAYPAPGYPLLLAALRYVTGDRVDDVVTLLQCVLDALTALWLSVAIGRLAPHAPRWLHYAWCVYLPAATLANEVLTETVSVNLAVTAVVLVLAFPIRTASVAGAALALGACVAIRPQFVVIGVVLAAFVVWQARGRAGWRITRGSALLLPAVAVLVMWSARNYRYFGHFAVAPPGGGLLFYSVAAPAHALLYGDGRLAESQRRLLERYAPRLFDRPRDVFEFQRALGRCARQWLAQHPLAAPAMASHAMWRKVASIRPAADALRRLLGERRRLGHLWHRRTWSRLSPSGALLVLWAAVSAGLGLLVTGHLVRALLRRSVWQDPRTLVLLVVCLLTTLPVLPLANRRYVVHFFVFWILGAALGARHHRVMSRSEGYNRHHTPASRAERAKSTASVS